MIYLDSNYIVRYYLREHGSKEVLKLVAKSQGVGSLALAKTECFAAFKRHLREEKIDLKGFQKAVGDFIYDENCGLWTFFPISSSIIRSACTHLQTIESSIHLRSADALHLACAKEEGFQEVYSHDKHLLRAAFSFGLVGIDLISS